MSSLHSFSDTLSSSVATIGYNYDRASLLLSKAERPILKTGYDINGLPYSLIGLLGQDKYQALALSKIIIQLHPDSLKDRTAEDYERFTEDENHLIGLQDHEGHLVGMAAIEAMDDESDHGSGPIVLHNGQHNSHEQAHWKTLCLLPEHTGKGHLEEFYETRIGLFIETGCSFAVLKSNTKKIIDFYTTSYMGWINQTKNPQKGWALDYNSEKAQIGKSVDVLIMKRDTAIEWYDKNKTGIVLPKPCIKNHAADNQPQPTIH